MNIRNWYKYSKNIWLVGILFISSIALHYVQRPAKDVALTVSSEEYRETVIPKGYTLIPIEIKNSESLDSIFGNFGFVNLYIEKNGTQRLIGKNIKLVRAPKNPNYFAVLVKDAQTHFITKYDTAFFVSIASENTGGTVFVSEEVGKKKYNPIHIGIEND